MTNVTVKSASGGQASLANLITLGSKLLTLSLENSLVMMQQATSLLPTLPDLRLRQASDACCRIPELDCPPRCVCDVRWQAAPGETPGLSIRVTNSSKTGRTFSLHATPFIGAGGSPGTITLAPTTLALAAGESGFVNATFTTPNVAEGEYDAEIIVQGAYQQAVCIKLDVKCAKTRGDERGVCEVTQGDPPVRIHAHNWYDHFQCTEPCFEPERQGDMPAHQAVAVGNG